MEFRYTPALAAEMREKWLDDFDDPGLFRTFETLFGLTQTLELLENGDLDEDADIDVKLVKRVVQHVQDVADITHMLSSKKALLWCVDLVPACVRSLMQSVLYYDALPKDSELLFVGEVLIQNEVDNLNELEAYLNTMLDTKILVIDVPMQKSFFEQADTLLKSMERITGLDKKAFHRSKACKLMSRMARLIIEGHILADNEALVGSDLTTHTRTKCMI